MNIYVGNLNYKVREIELKEIFEEYGDVSSVKIIIDRQTGKSKGFAFVEMENENDGNRAIEELNGAEFMERVLVVNKARVKQQTSTPRYNKR